MPLLLKIEDRQQKQAKRGYGQQGRLQPIEEVRFHGDTLTFPEQL